MAFFVKGEKIVLKKDATWEADGVEITHDQTRELFFRSVHWDENEKKYFLEVGYEHMFIEVEDTAVFVTALEQADSQGLRAKLSNAADAPIKADQLQYRDGNLYLSLSDGQKAKFLSAPYYDLLKRLQEDERYYFLTIGGNRANLSSKEQGRPGAKKQSG
ncbi:MAG: hypothetical protein AB1540_09885 [Bdellovibrionota bacterium]